jgi:hypothetical protein
MPSTGSVIAFDRSKMAACYVWKISTGAKFRRVLSEKRKGEAKEERNNDAL